MNNLLEKMKDQWLELSRLSFNSAEAGIAANVCEEAMGRIEQLEMQLAQIEAVCTDNMNANCNHRMALDFVRQIAAGNANCNHEWLRG